MVSKDVVNGQDSKLGEKLSDEEQAKEVVKADNLRLQKEEEERRKARMEKRRAIREEYNNLSRRNTLKLKKPWNTGQRIYRTLLLFIENLRHFLSHSGK